MMNVVKGALAGAIALGALVGATAEGSAMPTQNLAPIVASEAATQLGVQPVYYYGYYRRPFVYRYRRPFYYHRPYFYRRFY